MSTPLLPPFEFISNFFFKSVSWSCIPLSLSFEIHLFYTINSLTTLFLKAHKQAKLFCLTNFDMSESIPLVITQNDDDFENFTVTKHPFTMRQINLDLAANFDYVPPPQPTIHSIFNNHFKPSKSKSPKTNVKGHSGKNGVWCVNPSSCSKTGKKPPKP